MKIKKILNPAWIKHVPKPWILSLATLGPVGNKLFAPGTWASFAGLWFYTFCFYGLSPLSFLCLAILSSYLAGVICHAAEHNLQEKDPDCIVLDEFTAMPICFFGFHVRPETHALWVFLLTGFLLFRYFDIWKPLGIYKLQDLRGGLGIMLDDLAAALATNVVLHGIFHFLC
ncbi:MAG: phosphatidylglycerophosphatase A [Puniceicoccales bacterium]|jgi:phosphatidylglycerophosphatase A|nr:phosphatidylglycerophosphatase A [Puniceicoccales bacterium]